VSDGDLYAHKPYARYGHDEDESGAQSARKRSQSATTAGGYVAAKRIAQGDPQQKAKHPKGEENADEAQQKAQKKQSRQEKLRITQFHRKNLSKNARVCVDFF
jgi:hypothetical protein